MSKTDVKETGGNIHNKLKNKEMSRNIISDYMLGLQARADTSSADIIADIINPQHVHVLLVKGPFTTEELQDSFFSLVAF